MISYSERNVFSPETLSVFERVTRVVRELPTWWAFAEGEWKWCEISGTYARTMPRTAFVPDNYPFKETRCHEVVRAVQRFMCLGTNERSCVVDGHYRAMEHSWIVMDWHPPVAIIDCYAVGRLPMVQLVHTGSALVADHRDYREGPPRTDIDESLVAAMVDELKRRPIP